MLILQFIEESQYNWQSRRYFQRFFGKFFQPYVNRWLLLLSIEHAHFMLLARKQCREAGCLRHHGSQLSRRALASKLIGASHSDFEAHARPCFQGTPVFGRQSDYLWPWRHHDNHCYMQSTPHSVLSYIPCRRSQDLQVSVLCQILSFFNLSSVNIKDIGPLS